MTHTFACLCLLLFFLGLWDSQNFEFAQWKLRGEMVLAGSSVTEVLEQLDESQASLIQMLTQRHVEPFKERAELWLKKLSDVMEVLENWIDVQMLWTSLEAVFTGKTSCFLCVVLSLECLAYE